MAKRPTMSNLQKQINEVGIQLQKINNRVDIHEAALENINEREIVRLLKEKNTPKSSRYRYTYDEIANMMGCSPSTVSNIAKKYNLSRRLSVVD